MLGRLTVERGYKLRLFWVVATFDNGLYVKLGNRSYAEATHGRLEPPLYEGAISTGEIRTYWIGEQVCIRSLSRTGNEIPEFRILLTDRRLLFAGSESLAPDLIEHWVCRHLRPLAADF